MFIFYGAGNGEQVQQGMTEWQFCAFAGTMAFVFIEFDDFGDFKPHEL